MATKTKKYLVTTRTREILTIRQKPSSFLTFCSRCEKEAEMLTLDTATFQTGKTNLELFRLIGDNLLHSAETDRGRLLVCSNSLQQIGKQINKIKGEKLWVKK